MSPKKSRHLKELESNLGNYWTCSSPAKKPRQQSPAPTDSSPTLSTVNPLTLSASVAADNSTYGTKTSLITETHYHMLPTNTPLIQELEEYLGESLPAVPIIEYPEDDDSQFEDDDVQFVGEFFPERREYHLPPMNYGYHAAGFYNFGWTPYVQQLFPGWRPTVWAGPVITEVID